MSEPEDSRKKFLLEFYNQLWNSNNIRLNLIWASIGTLISSFAVYALTEKKVISLDIATTLVVLIAGWLLAHTIDMSFWYNRNLIIIRNIEKQFLTLQDAKEIIPYFVSHKKKNTMPDHLNIQSWLGIGIWSVVILFHIINNVLPSFCNGVLFSTYQIVLPYVASFPILILLLFYQHNKNKEYELFLSEAPGKEINNNEVFSKKGL